MCLAAAAATMLLAPPPAGAAPGTAAAPGDGARRAQEPPSAEARGSASRVASLLELAVEEYATALDGGEIVNRMEYDETEAFTRQARDLYASLLDDAAPAPAGADTLLPRFEALLGHVREQAPEAGYRQRVDGLVQALADIWGAQPVQMPGRRPSASRGASIYRQECMSCHGIDGDGDGPAADYYTPPPADLGAAFRHAGATPMRDYQVITYGVPRTAMAGYGDQLSVDERWDLVAYVQSMRFTGGEVAEGKSIALGGDDGRSSPIAGRIRTWATPDGSARLNDPQLAGHVREAWGEAAGDSLSPEEAESVVAYVRSLYGTTEAGVPEADRTVMVESRLGRIDSLAGRAVALSREGEERAARSAAVNAYMAFEGLEPTLQARAPDLVKSSERAFAELRNAVGTGDVDQARSRLRDQLQRVEETMTAESSWWAVAGQSFFIILREGFEAILIVGAIIAFLVKTDNEGRKREIYGGVWAALAASLLTAVAFETVFQVGPAGQEMLEGVTMLLATAVLFSVSYWLVSKLEHEKWERYLKDKMSRAVSSGSGLALAGVAFLAVYREGFETVLFYKALFISAEGGAVPISGGFLVGCVGLVALYLAFTRWGVKIPMRPFFAATSAVLYYMAIVFAGQGIHELQAGGIVGSTPVEWAPRLGLLGLYPTVETLAVQGLLLVVLAAGLAVTFGGRSGDGGAPADGAAGGAA